MFLLEVLEKNLICFSKQLNTCKIQDLNTSAILVPISFFISDSKSFRIMRPLRLNSPGSQKSIVPNRFSKFDLEEVHAEGS